jgi:hypothetical protein
MQLSATTENPTTYNENQQLQKLTQHILKITTVSEQSAPHVENSTTAEGSTTCIRELCRCVALQTSTMVHTAFILKGMEGVQFWYIPLQYKPSFTSSSNRTLILPKYTTMVHDMEYTECGKIPCPNFARFKCTPLISIRSSD